MTKQSLHGRLILVTGASRGIGREVALELARRGGRVVGTATSETGAASISAAFAEAGLSGTARVLQVNEDAAIDSLVAALADSDGAVQVLVNNAGITRDNLALRMSDREWDEVLDTDLRAVYKMTRAVLRGMFKARWGRIINITSVVGSLGNAGQVNYAAAKAGVAGMSRALAREVASRDITVNCVAPGFIDTDMTRGLAEQHRTALLGQIPAGRFGSVADVAAAVAFLASPEAGYITGTTLHVNGGMYMG